MSAGLAVLDHNKVKGKKIRNRNRNRKTHTYTHTWSLTFFEKGRKAFGEDNNPAVVQVCV